MLVQQQQEPVVVLDNVFFHFFHHSLLELRVAVGHQFEEVLVYRMERTLVHVLALLEKSLQRLKHSLTVPLVETVVLLSETSQKVFLHSVVHLVSIFFVQEGNLLDKNVEDLPNIADPPGLSYFFDHPQDAVEEPRLGADLGREEVLCHLADVADQSVFIDLGDVGGFLEGVKSTGNQLGIDLERLSEQSADYFLAVHVENVLELLLQELFYLL